MRTKAALLWGPNQAWSVEPVTVPNPLASEVTVKVAACGLCHTDEHLVTGDLPVPHWPILGGHEAAGEIVAIGSGVSDYVVGDKVILSAIPGCGRCRPCLRGFGVVCDQAFRAVSGESIADGTRRIRAQDGREVSAFCHVGGLAPYVTVHEYSLVRVEKDIPMDLARAPGLRSRNGMGCCGQRRAGAGWRHRRRHGVGRGRRRSADGVRRVRCGAGRRD